MKYITLGLLGVMGLGTSVWVYSAGFTQKSASSAVTYRSCCKSSAGSVDIACSQNRMITLIKNQSSKIAALPEHLRPQGQKTLDDFLSDVPKKITGVSDGGSAPTQAVCDQQMSAFYDLVTGAVLDASSAMGSTEAAQGLNVPDPNGDFLSFPDDQDLNFELPDKDLFVLLDGKKLVDSGGSDRQLRALGDGDIALIRLWLADTVERMARLYVGGSAQLDRDFPGSYPEGAEGFLPVFGIYQGYRPDLTSIVFQEVSGQAGSPGAATVCKSSENGIHKTEVNMGTKNTAWASCKSGIANAANKWFKNQAGVIASETAGSSLTSHICNGTPITPLNSIFAQARGQVVEQIMQVMLKMQKGILQGKLYSASAYSGDRFTAPDDRCPEAKGQILEFRNQYIKQKKAFLKDNPGKSPVALCTGQSPNMAACYLNSLKTEIELQWVSRYAFCVFKTVTDELIDAALDAATDGGA